MNPLRQTLRRLALVKFYISNVSVAEMVQQTESFMPRLSNVTELMEVKGKRRKQLCTIDFRGPKFDQLHFRGRSHTMRTLALLMS